jgi:antitoxin (DNA-binding transcriptional repressor) of toxin-antitoxin stability system
VVTSEEVAVRHVGVREFKNQATSLMSSGETLVIERHGKPIGFFVPVEAKDRQAGREALGRLGRLVDDLGAKIGLDEEALAQEITEDHPDR